MRSRLKYPSEVKQLPPPSAFKILALSGGGYRGLFTAFILADIEKKLGVSIAPKFQLLAGTSMGGLLAAGLAIGKSATDLLDAVALHGPKIFDDRLGVGPFRLWRKPKGPLGGALSSKYNRDALITAFEAVIGKDNLSLRMKDVGAPLLLVATCITTRSPYLMTNFGAGRQLGRDMLLIDALTATSAAPGYFPAFDTTSRSLVDGGLVANAPDMMAINEVLHARKASLDLIKVMSVGTARANEASIPTVVGKRGLGSWLLGDFVPSLLELQEKAAIAQASTLLGARYWRIDTVPSGKQNEVLDLDLATGDASRTLQLLAQETSKTVSSNQLAKWFSD